MSNLISQHLKIDDANRDKNWEYRFLELFPSSKVSLLSDQPESGPDGMPYLLVETLDEDSIDGEPAGRLLSWLSEHGIGLVINPRKEHPDYIFTYGMLWYGLKTGRFLEPEVKARDLGAVSISKTSEFQFGDASEDYLPKDVRKYLREFLLAQGVYSPRLCVFSENGLDYDLGLFVESLGNPPEKEYLGIAQALSWFLPQHYSVTFVSDADFKTSFAL